MVDGHIRRSEFILGGQKSGKSRRAELLARDWLAQSKNNKALLVATAQAWDDEMRERIARHQQDRAAQVPGMGLVEEPLDIARAIQLHSNEDTLLVIDCLTLWLTHRMMPISAEGDGPESLQAAVDALVAAISYARGPLVLVGNEIGLGVIPMGREVRAFVDELGRLNQAVASVCERVTLMAAGMPLTLKDTA